MGKFKDRTGEENYNTFGSKMIIVEYRKCSDIDIYFPQYNWTARSVEYGNFKKGNILCPYEPTTYGIGYIGEGKYKIHDENNKLTKCYTTWHSMLQRCYDEKCQEKQPTYKNCKICKEWLNFQNFAEWYYNNYYKIEGERMCLDKDILVKGNKMYSPENCIFVPHNINILFTKRDKVRGKHPIGVCYHKQTEKFEAKCSVYDNEKKIRRIKYLGYYETPEQAFEVYKQFKEKYIKQVADYYKEHISNKLYNTLYKYEVEITD